MKKYKFSIIAFIVFLTVFIYGCSPVKTVAFDTLVDTKTKPITVQQKKTFKIDGQDIYASNEFDAARLNGFQKLNDSTALVIIEPENAPINPSPHYAFKTWSDSPKTFYYTFKYPDGVKHRYIPKIKKDKEWIIIDSSSIIKNDKTITIKLNINNKPMFVAAQEVHSSADVKNWYNSILKGNEDVLRISSAGKTHLGRDIPVLEISKGTKKNKDVLVLMTRQHPPELTGYFAFQYFVETILEQLKNSTEFLDKYRLLVFPILNPDGVDLGHWRHNYGGVDLNRDWANYNQPEIKNTVKYISKSLKKSNSKIVLGIDFHSTRFDVFYTNITDKKVALSGFEYKWFSGLENNISNYKANVKPGNAEKPVSKEWFLHGHNAVGITYEIGDKTPKDRIKQISTASAIEMMRILIEEY